MKRTDPLTVVGEELDRLTTVQPPAAIVYLLSLRHFADSEGYTPDLTLSQLRASLTPYAASEGVAFDYSRQRLRTLLDKLVRADLVRRAELLQGGRKVRFFLPLHKQASNQAILLVARRATVGIADTNQTLGGLPVPPPFGPIAPGATKQGVCTPLSAWWTPETGVFRGGSNQANRKKQPSKNGSKGPQTQLLMDFGTGRSNQANAKKQPSNPRAVVGTRAVQSARISTPLPLWSFSYSGACCIECAERDAPRVATPEKNLRAQAKACGKRGEQIPFALENPNPPEPGEEETSPKAILWRAGVQLLRKHHHSDKSARSIIGRLLRLYGEEAVVFAIGKAALREPAEPVSWMTAVCKSQKGGRGQPPPDDGTPRKRDGSVDIHEVLRQRREGVAPEGEGVTIDHDTGRAKA